MASIAIVSDIHADLPALESVLAEIDARRIAHIWCLGDFCSGGPHPVETFDLVMDRCEIVLAGNHEHFVRAHVWEGWRAWWAEAARLAHAALGHDRVSVLGSMRSAVRSSEAAGDAPSVTLVHGALTNPRDSFITQPRDAAVNFELLKTRLMFYGHTHVPLCWYETGARFTPGVPRGGAADAEPPSAVRVSAEPTRNRALINPGAVCDGQGARWLEWDVAAGAVTWHQTPTRGHGGRWRP